MIIIYLFSEIKREVYWAMIRENGHIFTWDRIVYDDMSIMFALDKIDFHNNTHDRVSIVSFCYAI